jgi:hypothetical protein
LQTPISNQTIQDGENLPPNRNSQQKQIPLTLGRIIQILPFNLAFDKPTVEVISTPRLHKGRMFVDGLLYRRVYHGRDL